MVSTGKTDKMITEKHRDFARAIVEMAIAQGFHSMHGTFRETADLSGNRMSFHWMNIEGEAEKIVLDVSGEQTIMISEPKS